MKSLRTRVLLLIVGFGLLMATMLATIMYASVREYYNDWIYDKSSSFAERILEAHPNLWRDYEADPASFGQQLRQYTLYSPNTGLYLIDQHGRVLASAGESRQFWGEFRVDLEPVREALGGDPRQPVHTTDPDRQGDVCMVAARPVVQDGRTMGWLFVVPRQASLGEQMPEMLRSYAIRTTAKVALMTIAIGVLLTIAMIALLTRPLTALTRATEQVRRAGFCDELCESSFPDLDRDDEIGRLSRTFRDAFERLKLETERVQTTDAGRREMVASVSHDLRTPLTALIGQLETIRLKGDALSDPARREMLERAMQNAQHLRRLTEALAELARLDSSPASTRRWSSARSRTCSTTHCGSRRPAAGSPSRCGPRRPACGSRWWTPGPACCQRTSPRSSTASSRPAARATSAVQAAWDWRSSSAWPSCTAARPA